MRGKIEIQGNNYIIRTEDGKTVNTMHPQRGLIPYTWDKRYNKMANVKIAAEELFNIDIIE